MKIFQCDHCDHPLYFESNTCENCGHLAGYRASDRKMLTFHHVGKNLVSDHEKINYKYCKNQRYEVCNWVLLQDDPNNFCQACQLNRTIPNLSERKNFVKWKNLEVAKHRLIYQLQKIGLELSNKSNTNRLRFDFIAKFNNANIMTGHANGVITILLSEADSVLREQRRKQLLEPYRTLIGHLRHEVGHYYWDQLVYPNSKVLEEYRSIFGDERQNYAEALQTYYQKEASQNWQESYISKYATAHAWEDWAETWAHYLHIMDMVETAHFFNLHVAPGDDLPKDMKTDVSFDPYKIEDFVLIVQTCEALSFAVNNINRAMGIPDVYPFVISKPVVEKLKFIHRLLLDKRAW